MIRQCCQCKRVWHKGQWIAPAALPPEIDLKRDDISHGYCEECFVGQMRVIHSLSKGNNPPAKKPANSFYFY